MHVGPLAAKRTIYVGSLNWSGGLSMATKFTVDGLGDQLKALA